LTDGPLTIDAAGNDAAGNNADVEPVAITLDTQAFITIDDVGTGSDGYINAVESADPLILSGSTDVEDGQTVTVTFTDANSNTATNTAIVTAGAWSLTVDASGLDDGALTIDASVSDVAGN